MHASIPNSETISKRQPLASENLASSEGISLGNKRLLLRVGCIPSSSCPTVNELNGVYGGSFSQILAMTFPFLKVEFLNQTSLFQHIFQFLLFRLLSLQMKAYNAEQSQRLKRCCMGACEDAEDIINSLASTIT